ncbi:hypothetical protein [Microbacterium jejuense]|uniref:hypothetical protein n=1 Tax=Microbacterium jejuense TaxID=1263637 RepID=UPI0031EDED82
MVRLPSSAQAGARRRVALAGLGLPSVVTSAETEDFVRVFRWFLLHAGADGIPLQAGAIEPSFLTDAAAVLDVDETRLHEVLVAAKRLQLVYSRRGRLRAKKQLLVSAATAPTLWSSLAKALRDERTTSGAARDLLLLSIADGSFGSDTGMREIAHAYALISAVSAATRPPYWHEDRYTDCASRCECAASGTGSWHDLVTESVRRASDAARADGAEPVLSSLDHYESGVPQDWLDGYDVRWGPLDPRPAKADPVDRHQADLARLLDEVSPMIEVLVAFGLTQQSDGSWIIPPTLREFARATLAASLGDPRTDGTAMYDYVQSDTW